RGTLRWVRSSNTGRKSGFGRGGKRCWSWSFSCLPSLPHGARLNFQADRGSAWGVARALAADQPILLMDEPFGALDPVTRVELQREFRALASRLEKTIVFVTHDVREALFLGTRIALLDGGRLVGMYAPEEFLNTTEPEVRPFAASLHLGRGDEELR